MLSKGTEPIEYMITKEFIRLAYIGIYLYAGETENAAAVRSKKLKTAEWTMIQPQPEAEGLAAPWGGAGVSL